MPTPEYLIEDVYISGSVAYHNSHAASCDPVYCWPAATPQELQRCEVNWVGDGWCPSCSSDNRLRRRR
jgi:hypothetical protein